ncbi:hypothetical protein D918_01288, partial [Trichuris suis]
LTILGSAAAKAGIRQGDRIVKVNGVLVTGLNHLDVAKLMSGSSYVSLTLFGRSEGAMSSMAVKGVMTNGKRLQRRSTDSGHFDLACKAKPSMSGSTTKRLEWRLKRRELVQQMLVEEKKQLEVLRQEATDTSSNGDRLQLIEKAERRIGNLEIQLKVSDRLLSFFIGKWAGRKPKGSCVTFQRYPVFVEVKVAQGRKIGYLPQRQHETPLM